MWPSGAFYGPNVIVRDAVERRRARAGGTGSCRGRSRLGVRTGRPRFSCAAVPTTTSATRGANDEGAGETQVGKTRQRASAGKRRAIVGEERADAFVPADKLPSCGTSSGAPGGSHQRRSEKRAPSCARRSASSSSIPAACQSDRRGRWLVPPRSHRLLPGDPVFHGRRHHPSTASSTRMRPSARSTSARTRSARRRRQPYISSRLRGRPS